MHKPSYECADARRATAAGFGLVDALVALVLLALTLLGACGGLHFALRAAHAATLQARAVDLVADLGEDVYGGDAARLQAALGTWRGRVINDLPVNPRAASSLATRQLQHAALNDPVEWFDLRLSWNGLPGTRNDALRLPLTTAATGLSP
jgi:Tfp pilus assembly protein PilV